MKCPSAGCPGIVRITNTARDGERAHCERCHVSVSIERLVALVDEKDKEIEGLKHQMSRSVPDPSELGWG